MVVVSTYGPWYPRTAHALVRELPARASSSPCQSRCTAAPFHLPPPQNKAHTAKIKHKTPPVLVQIVRRFWVLHLISGCSAIPPIAPLGQYRAVRSGCRTSRRECARTYYILRPLASTGRCTPVCVGDGADCLASTACA
eukprot:2781046-Rhodomonas_salina.2